MSSKRRGLRRHQNLRHGDNAVPPGRLVTQAALRRAPQPGFPRISRDRVELLLLEQRLAGSRETEARDG